MSNEEIKLPPLPRMAGDIDVNGETIPFYTAEQMHAYVLADRAARPVADAGEAVACRDCWDGAACGEHDRAAPSARTLSDDQIWNFWLYRDCMHMVRQGDQRGQFIAVVRTILDASAAPAEAPSVGRSLLRPAISVANPLPPGCYCEPGKCAAPRIMGRQTPCRDPLKRDALQGKPEAAKGEPQ
jgi:hypothetical protein